MAIFDMLFWWYAHGWNVFFGKLKDFLAGITDFFSMDSLLRTLFKPYRQISAETSDSGALDTRFQMFIDRLISRIVGFFSRLILLIIGLILIVVGGALSLVLILLWPLIPLLPIVGICLSVMGVLI